MSQKVLLGRFSMKSEAVFEEVFFAVLFEKQRDNTFLVYESFYFLQGPTNLKPLF